MNWEVLLQGDTILRFTADSIRTNEGAILFLSGVEVVVIVPLEKLRWARKLEGTVRDVDA